MHNIIDRPYSIHLNHINNGLYYSKRKLFDEAQYTDFPENYFGFVNKEIIRWSPNHIFASNNYINQSQNNNYNNNNKEVINMTKKHTRHPKKSDFAQSNEPRLLTKNINTNDTRNMPVANRFNSMDFVQKFSNHPQTKIMLIEDLPPRTKLKKQNDYGSNSKGQAEQQNILVKKSMVDMNNQQTNNLKLNRKFPTFNNGSMLNSLADYNLNNLDDKMFNLNIDYSRNDIKNMSLDSLTNIRVKVSPKKDEFAAYRLSEHDTKNENDTILNNTNDTTNSDHSTFKNKFSSLSSYNCSKLLDSGSPKQADVKADKAEKSESAAGPQPVKKNRHHHHRARRNNRNKNKNNSELKKSQSSLVHQDDMQNDNQDSLSAFDFSNTDEFWEDDIIINSELIEPDKFMPDEIESPPIKFVSCEGINGLLIDGDKFDLKESIIKDKLYEDILDFKDNLTIN